MVAPPIFTEVICGKLSDSSIRDLYMRCWMDIAADPINILSPQFVNLGLSNIDVLDKGAIPMTPLPNFEGLQMFTIGVRLIIFLEKNIVVEDAVSAKSDYKYKTDFVTWRENQEFERQNIARSRPPLDLTPVGVKNVRPQTLTTDLSKRK